MTLPKSKGEDLAPVPSRGQRFHLAALTAIAVFCHMMLMLTFMTMELIICAMVVVGSGMTY